MIGNSLFEYLEIRAAIAFFRLIAPASIVYLLLCAFKPQWIYAPLLIYAVVEALFYLFVYLPRKARLQAPPKNPPPKLTHSERQLVFFRCIEAAKCHSSGAAPYPTDWFLPKSSTPHREDVIDWLLWALFSTTREESNIERHKEEIDGYVDQIEDLLRKKLTDGYSHGRTVKSMRVTVDPVQMLHRPLLWYIIVACVDAYTSLALTFLGFKHYTPIDPHWSRSFPPRPVLTLLSSPAPKGVVLPYWYRPHKSTTKKPVMFLHGIGIGIWPYIPLLRSMLLSDGDVGFVLPELLPISMHMTPQSLPPRPLMLESLNLILEDVHGREGREPKQGGWSQIVLASHSYGTFIAGWIIRQAVEIQSPSPSASDGVLVTPKSKVQEKVAHIILVDPIPILLSNPAVAHNFLYREPWSVSPTTLGSISSFESATSESWYSSAAAWQLWYFASRDADIAHTLHRAFFWAEGGVWKEDLSVFMGRADGGPSMKPLIPTKVKRKRNVAVVLGGMDQIVPSEAVRKYLTGEDSIEERWRGVLEGAEEGGELEVLFNSKLDHAVVFDEERWTQPLLELLRRYVSDQ